MPFVILIFYKSPTISWRSSVNQSINQPLFRVAFGIQDYCKVH